MNHTTVVKPSQSTRETKWLFLIVTIIVMICAAIISLRNHSYQAKTIEQWQIDGFKELTPVETAVFTSLQTAALEIGQTHELDGYWMNILELEMLYVPPFAKEAAWKKQGQIKWSMTDLKNGERHIAIYKGVPGNNDVGGVFLLLMLHDHKKKQGNVAAGPEHAPYEIWFNKKKDQKTPDIITDQALIAGGWREVVARTGEDEVMRTKGKAIQ